MKPIRKAVFPVAGLGTRFLPATKTIPKEMLPVVDKPVIQHVVEEARAAGIEHFIFVTGRGKGAIEDHFDHVFELNATLQQRGRDTDLARLKDNTPLAGRTSFTRQQEPLGLGHAVWCARDLVGDEPFAVLLPDMLHEGETPCLADMIKERAQHGGQVIAAYEVPNHETHRYGILDLHGETKGTPRIHAMIEKPQTGKAPSNFAISGRYILSPQIFDVLEHQPRGAGGEIQLTDAMVTLMSTMPYHAHLFRGRVFDTGHQLGFLTANIAYALKRPDIGQELRTIIKELM